MITETSTVLMVHPLAKDLNIWQRFSYLRTTMSNWPLVVPDKLGLVRTCCYRARSGLVVWCRPRSTDVNEAVAILSGHEYPPHLLRAGNGCVIIDIGANIGSFVLFVASLNRGVDFRGIAFEPFAPNFALLNKNVAANGISAFRTVQAAVTDIDGAVHLKDDPRPDRVRVSGPAGRGDPTATPSHRLSTYCASNEITSIELLKMDAEGSEYDIVESDYAFLAASVANVLVEYHELGGTRTFRRLRERLEVNFAVTVVREHSRTGVLHAQNRRLREPTP
jgi:FkbM family methyltransferase